MSINYLLTDQNLYFRGSCKAGMCTKDADGDDFDTTFNGKTKFRSMWTKMNLAAAGFPFVAADIKDIQEFDWAILFTLIDGRKFLYGLNNFNRLCSTVSGVVLVDLSIYDHIQVDYSTSLLSKGTDLYFCGASFGFDDIDYTQLFSAPASIQIDDSSALGWNFVNRTVIDISGGNNGFIIRTPTEIFGLGFCAAFECVNFQGDFMIYSGSVQKLQWFPVTLKVVGSDHALIQYRSEVILPVYFNDSVIVVKDQYLNQSGTLDFTQQLQSESKNKIWPALLGVFLIADAIACLAVYYFTQNLKKHYKARNELVQVYLQTGEQFEFTVREVISDENVRRNAEITHDINALNVFEFE
ncbi:Hypothetical_protein [Hexamita inflata]|uniref:Hypothetical_protein n=1 Tax=Hexamita inflata TaxID=28002 RepID=A0AA86PH62_9EUKA|nr:Hypothetical protein HINF_LOCUS11270 [Hexamita inflata]CAI9938926.1 Hypothetical protein HINF_LOCUS26571 [Hexamita inflata]